MKILLWFLFRAVLAVFCFVYGFKLLFWGHPGAGLVGCGVLLAGAWVIAFPIARILAAPFSAIFWPTGAEPPPPVYGIPESHVKKGLYAEAIREYHEIIRKWPHELKPYVDLLDLAVRRMRDPDLAARIHGEALLKLKKPEERETVTRLYEAMKEARHEEG
ncbi:MAG TPA: hypothetical protein P5567_09550 [Kiritimatiellia bacterium]|nr:hypothetical protein [Kiritimatiellia bacterium]HRZ12685.1 hypothetical protein [Kiritimatiellia bacterium]HSA19547.1 hypothetical protein [Kiritimatiellia bacterium]